MFNKSLLICLLLVHLQITAFAIETEEKPTKSCFQLFSVKVAPERESLKPKPVSQEAIKGCSFFDIIKSMFRKKTNKDLYPPSKQSKTPMPYSLIITNFNPEHDEMIALLSSEKYNYTPIDESSFKHYGENSKYLTSLANSLITGDISSITLEEYGEFFLNGERKNFIELPLDSRWYIEESYDSVIGFSAEFYEKNEYGENYTAYRSRVLVPSLRRTP